MPFNLDQIGAAGGEGGKTREGRGRSGWAGQDGYVKICIIAGVRQWAGL